MEERLQTLNTLRDTTTHDRLQQARDLSRLRADLEAGLRQRSQLRAKLVAETERREAAEAELVALGAQWLGTETQAALRRRAEQQDERRLNAHAAALAREAEQRVAQAQAETAVLRQRLGEEAPSPVQLRSQLRAACRARR